MRRKIRRLSYIVLPLVWVAAVGMSCGTVKDDEPQITEACAVLRTADSLRAQGVLIDDSTALARAVTLLGKHPRRHADDYVRACYYYGCLLRKRNNYTAAMQTFIHAAHTESRRHDIKGRVYSNMGSLCQIAEDFEMSHKMYSLSAEQFLAAKDTTAYYYARNSMAFELAEQKKKSETLALLGDIETGCTDDDVLCLIAMTKAVLYRNFEQYDSAIYYAGRELLCRPNERMGLMVKAQSFSLLGMKDSAVFYARKVTEHSPSWSEQTNAYYILSNDDETLSKEDALKIASDRADAQKMLETQRSRLAQAVMLLQQDMDRNPYFVDHIYLLLILFIFVAGGLVAVIIVKKKHTKSIKDIEKQRLQLKKDQQIIISQNSRIKEKSERLKNEYNEHINGIIQELEQNINALMQSENWQKETEWDNYDRFCETANRNFFMIANKLKAKKVLCEKEIRFCILVMTGCFNSRQIASLICYAESGIRNYKQHIAKKLGIKSKDLRTYLLSLAVGEPFLDTKDENIHTPKEANG